MKNRIIAVILCVLLISAIFTLYNKRAETKKKDIPGNEVIQNGDIIFHTSMSAQSKAIQLATGSKYSHCGIIFIKNSQYYVYEAVQPVKLTPLSEWIKRGKNGHYVIKRLKNADETLTPAVLSRMQKEAERFQGKNYDLTFEWSDDKIYCSELIWKIYKRGAGVEVGKLQKLKEFDLTNPIVNQKLLERYGDNIPLDETVISPQAIYECKLLKKINR